MWGSSKRQKRRKTVKIQTLIGQHTELQGDVRFSGGLHVDGVIKGNVLAEPDSNAMLTLSEHGTIEGEVRVQNIVLNGSVIGDVYAEERIELDTCSRVTGNVYYNLIEMAIGAEVNGNLVHQAGAGAKEPGRLTVDPPKPVEMPKPGRGQAAEPPKEREG
ncbi:bactofilin family protein [Endothiovibrio diazotrophicus]